AATALLPLIAAPAAAQDWRVEEVAVQAAYFGQSGRGAQSQADVCVIDGVERGSEELDVYQPSFRVALRQNARVRHVATIPVDIVTSASADALDAVSSASRVNEALELDLRTEWRPTDDDALTFRYGAHIEEYLKGGFGGLAYARELAQDNATLRAGVDLFVDAFDPLTPQGLDLGFTKRSALHAFVGGSQILSPTTVASLGYDLTYQWGRLEQVWNSLPTDRRVVRPGEIFPGTRLRHALSAELRQHVPATRSTLHAGYRYYRDDFGLDAHTLELELYQWLGRRLYVRGGYRLHDQSAVDFFTTWVPPRVHEDADPRTADSDLAAFRAHEWSLRLVLFTSLDGERGRESISIGFSRYDRPHLDVDAVMIGYRWER
ncbi:MAG: hypothetical protein CMN31_25370, partial [Sandaracinus sp.]|nr:hypothetical protein [Sandaracinus sp.]